MASYWSVTAGLRVEAFELDGSRSVVKPSVYRGAPSGARALTIRSVLWLNLEDRPSAVVTVSGSEGKTHDGYDSKGIYLRDSSG
jgi:hypothetical protein